MTVDVLEKLSCHPCGNLLPIARRAISAYKQGKLKKVIIPMVKRPVSLSINWWCGPFRGCYDSDRNTIVLFAWEEKDMAFTLVHEMRHAQQHAILGERKYARETVKAAEARLTSPLEIDARAAIVVAGGNPNKEFLDMANWPNLAQFFKEMDGKCRRHAKLIGPASPGQARRSGMGPSSGPCRNAGRPRAAGISPRTSWTG